MFVIGLWRVHILWPVIRPEWVCVRHIMAVFVTVDDQRTPCSRWLLHSIYPTSDCKERTTPSVHSVHFFERLFFIFVIAEPHCWGYQVQFIWSNILHIYTWHIHNSYMIYESVYVCGVHVPHVCVHIHMVPRLEHLNHGGIHKFFFFFFTGAGPYFQ